MTIDISNNASRISYAVAQGATQQVFAVPFEFFEDSDISVYVDEVLKVITTDYAISGGNGSTGTVTFNLAGEGETQQVLGATGGSTVTIVRSTTIERTTDFTTGTDINRAALNTQLDTLTAIAADNKDRANRTLHIPDFEIAPNLELPSINDRKGRVLDFHETSGAIKAGPLSNDITTIANNITAILAADDEAAAAAASATAAAASAVDATNNGAAQVALAADQAALAETAKTAAELAETNAETSETNAAASATTATTGASTATTQAGIATTKAGEASASATAAAASAASIVGAEANAANSAVQAAASQVAAATSAASAANIFDTFDDKYLGSKTSEPTTDNDGDPLAVGALFYNQTSGGMFVWDGSEWVAASSAGGVSLNYFYYTATAGQTTFSGSDDNSVTLAYTLDNIIVTLNGIILENGTDYTANTATSVVLTSGAALNDELNILAFKSFTTADMVSATNGGTFAADVTFLNNIIVNGTVDGRDVAADGALAASAVQPNDSPTFAGINTTGNATFGDNDKAIFGAGSDLQIYHDGSNSYIENTAPFMLIESGTIVLRNTAGTEDYAKFNENSDVKLYFDNAQKFATTSTGIDVTGTVTADGLTFNAEGDTITFQTSGTPDGRITTGDDIKANSLQLEADNAVVINSGQDDGGASEVDGTFISRGSTFTKTALFDVNGDISFYEDTGTTPKFFWDASAESLGIGTSSPSFTIESVSATSNNLLRLRSEATSPAGAVSEFRVVTGANTVDLVTGSGDHLIFSPSFTEAMRIDSSGNLLVGRTSNNWSTAAGFTAQSNGAIIASRADASGYFNRLSTDGSIVNFAKDGATVGSIGVVSAQPYFVSGNTGIRLSNTNNGIYPAESDGTNRDAAIDLGAGASRFKDAHFSGTVNAASFSGDGSNLTGVGGSTTAGDVGTYAWLWRDNAGTALGSTHAGSSLFFATQSDDNSSGAVANVYKGNGIVRSGISPSGTWRAMGSAGTYSTAYGQATLYVRIS